MKITPEPYWLGLQNFPKVESEHLYELLKFILSYYSVVFCLLVSHFISFCCFILQFLFSYAFFISFYRDQIHIKGALDKYNIYIFIASTKENLKSNQYRKFQPILPMSFHFMRYFVNSIIFRVPHRLLYNLCIYSYLLKSTLKNRKC